MTESDPPITPEFLLNAYAQGYFPMAKTRRGRNLYWFNPEIRTVLKPEDLHLSRSLRKFLRNAPFKVTFNRAFAEIIRACADHRTPTREESWINAEIIRLYTQLHQMGFAHSVEVWDTSPPATRAEAHASPEHVPCENQEIFTGTIKNQLIGGLYGVAIGGVFCGESMFSHRSNASKMALVALARHLQDCGFALLDAQFENPHLVQFGFHPMAREEYLATLHHSLSSAVSASTRFSTTSPSSATTSGA